MGNFTRRIPEVNVVPSVPTEYCMDLASAEVQLLRYALKEAPESTSRDQDKFIVLSDSTLPVKPFAEVFATVTANAESDFCIYPVDEWFRWKESPGNVRVAMPAHAQFVHFNRRDALSLVARWGEGDHPLRNLSFFNGSGSLSYSKAAPAWSFPVLDGGSARKTLNMKDYYGWEFCADEVVPFSIIFGGVVFNSTTHTRYIDGFGTLWNDDKHRHLPQGRCLTYFSFYMWSLDGWTFESELAEVENSTVYTPDENAPTHPLEFGDLSSAALQMLRETPYLFARKFRADARLPSYEEVVLKPSLKVEPPRPVLHFLFLAIDSVSHAPIWQEFFEHAPSGTWRAWLHCKTPAACRNSSFYRSVPGVQIVKRVPTSYCNDLLSASVQLMKEALRSTAAPPGVMEKFILASDTTLPVKPFSEVYSALTEHDTSDFCIYPSTQWLQAKVNDTSLYAPWHHQWIVLNRPDAYSLMDWWRPTWDEYQWPDWNVSLHGASRTMAKRKHLLASEFDDGDPSWACTDGLAPFGILYGAFVPGGDGGQHYPGIGTLSLQEKSRNQGRCRTLVLWNVTSTQERVKQFMVDDPGTDIVLPTWGDGGGDPAAFRGFSDDALQRLRASEYLFIRKVLPNATLPNYAKVALSESSGHGSARQRGLES